MGKRWPTRAVVVTLAVVASLAVGSGAQAAVSGAPRLLGALPHLIAVDKATWVHAHWLAVRNVCDVKVTVTAEDADVAYPASTDTYTSFSGGDSLDAGDVDYTAFGLTPDDTGLVRLRLHMSYVRVPSGSTECDGDVRERTSRAYVAAVPGSLL
jgi:hypothetical protein